MEEIRFLKQSKHDIDLELANAHLRNQTLINNLNDLEQYSSWNNIRIFVVIDNKKDETIQESENLVREILRKKRILNFGPEHFEICHTIGKYGKRADRAIIVKFLYRKSKVITIKNRRNLAKYGITIAEDLTHTNCKKAARH